MTSRVERVSDELARELLNCPLCHVAPEIYRRSGPDGTFCAVACPCQEKEWFSGNNCCYPHNPKWHPSLYEAVMLWQVTAKLSGVRERVKDVPF